MTSVDILNAIIICLSGLGIIVALVVSVYLITLIIDKCKWFNSGSDILTPQELEERRTASSLTRQAGIAGILAEERLRIFRTFFEKRSIPYKKIEVAKEVVDLEACEISSVIVSQHEKSNDNEEGGKCDGLSTQQTTPLGDDAVEATTTTKEDNDSRELDEKAANACPICLNEYDDGDKVITGTKCSHMFHYGCCMQWFEKGNDHCPYCREDMMSPNELLEAAREELGDARIDKMIRINEDAARRLDAMQQSGQTELQVLQNPIQSQEAQNTTDRTTQQNLQNLSNGANLNAAPGIGEDSGEEIESPSEVATSFADTSSTPEQDPSNTTDVIINEADEIDKDLEAGNHNDVTTAGNDNENLPSSSKQEEVPSEAIHNSKSIDADKTDLEEKDDEETSTLSEQVALEDPKNRDSSNGGSLLSDCDVSSVEQKNGLNVPLQANETTAAGEKSVDDSKISIDTDEEDVLGSVATYDNDGGDINDENIDKDGNAGTNTMADLPVELEPLSAEDNIP